MVSSTRKTTKKKEKEQVVGFPLYKDFKPKTKNQSEYVRLMAENDVTLCSGPAGSGKTECSIGLACDWLHRNKIEQIVITRPTVETGKGIGFLPGDVNDKVFRYFIPAIDVLERYLGADQVKRYMHEKYIRIEPLEYLRGRNFHGSFMVLDEAQNCTLEQIKMFLTRMGRESKCVLSGDIQQSDLMNTGFQNVIDKMKDVESVGVMKLTTQDIIRNSVISRILEALN